MEQHVYDVIVIGGGAAGLNGALMLARARRDVLVLDAGEPRNAPAQGVHGLLGHEGVPPAELLARGRKDVEEFGGALRTTQVVGAGREGTCFRVDTADGDNLLARRLLVTTGLVDELPEVPGLRERWGRDVLHCPYCHGWEVRDQQLVVIGFSPMSLHQAQLFRQWSPHVTLVRHDLPALDAQQELEFRARGIHVIDDRIEEVLVEEDRLRGVRLGNGERLPCDALTVATRMVARAAFLNELGLVPVEHPSGTGQHIPTDPMGRTTVPGVWAAGNVTELSAQVGAAAAGGALAAAQLNTELVLEDVQLAVAAAATD